MTSETEASTIHHCLFVIHSFDLHPIFISPVPFHPFTLSNLPSSSIYLFFSSPCLHPYRHSLATPSLYTFPLPFFLPFLISPLFPYTPYSQHLLPPFSLPFTSPFHLSLSPPPIFLTPCPTFLYPFPSHLPSLPISLHASPLSPPPSFPIPLRHGSPPFNYQNNIHYVWRN